MKRALLVVALVSTVACGSNSPTAPSAPATAQLAGVWRGSITETSVTGGECLGAVFVSGIGTTAPVSIAFTQNGSAISATATATNTGANYTYAGSVGQSALTMNGSTCSACNLSGIRCLGSTAARDMRIQTFAANGTVSGNALTGTETESYNVFVSGTTTSVGILTFSYSFALTRQ